MRRLQEMKQGIVFIKFALYRSMIGSLLYLTANRPNLCYSVGVCARYQASLKDSHLLEVKKIIKYISGTTYYSLRYTKNTTISQVGYCIVIGLETQKIGRVLLEDNFSLETTLCLGLAKTKTTYHFPQPRQSTKW